MAIVILSLAPFPEFPAAEDIPLADKWTHMVMYASLTLAIWIQYLHSHHKTNWTKLTIGGILAPAAWGGLMELAQAYLTTYRSGEWLDFIANCIGVAIATLLGLTILRKLFSR
ncbi:MAG: VanZ family protein [Bacteroidaceae bacterium]